MRQIILDTETTGLSPQDGHRVIEIGCVELVNRRFTQQNFWHYINPQRAIDADAVAVHGITEEFLSDKPTFDQIASQFINYLSGAEVIAHNAPFDVGFLDHELQSLRQGLPKLNEICTITDTLVLARTLYPGQRNSLDALCKRLHVNNSKRTKHGALLDAEILADVYLRLTGGQESFNFGQSTKKQQQQSSVVRPDKPLKVIYADADELHSHQQKLTAMQKKGSVLWLSDTH